VNFQFIPIGFVCFIN